MTESRWIGAGCHIAVWTLAGVVAGTQTLIGSTFAERSVTLGQALLASLCAWYVRGALSPVAMLVARRLPLTRDRLARRLPVHVGVGLTWSIVATVVIGFSADHLELAVKGPFLVELATSALTFAILVAVVQVADYYRVGRDREVTAARLEARLATARHDLLRMQLNPRLLHAALDDVSALLRDDVGRARAMVDELSELVRLSLRYTGEAEVSLSEEVGFLQRYLQLEQMRFGHRLEARVDVDSSALDARVPYLILQPLVENAMRHGGALHAGSGRVEVRGRADGEALVLEVYGDGARQATRPGSAAADGPPGPELESTRERLRESYGSSHRLELTDLADGGLSVRLELPLRRSAPEGRGA